LFHLCIKMSQAVLSSNGSCYAVVIPFTFKKKSFRFVIGKSIYVEAAENLLLRVSREVQSNAIIEGFKGDDWIVSLHGAVTQHYILGTDPCVINTLGAKPDVGTSVTLLLSKAFIMPMTM